MNKDNQFVPAVISTDETLLKVKDDEPIFILRAQDSSSPKAIIGWISQNFHHTPDYKLRDAFEQALAMKNWKGQKKIAD